MTTQQSFSLSYSCAPNPGICLPLAPAWGVNHSDNDRVVIDEAGLYMVSVDVAFNYGYGRGEFQLVIGYEDSPLFDLAGDVIVGNTLRSKGVVRLDVGARLGLKCVEVGGSAGICEFGTIITLIRLDMDQADRTQEIEDVVDKVLQIRNIQAPSYDAVNLSYVNDHMGRIDEALGSHREDVTSIKDMVGTTAEAVGTLGDRISEVAESSKSGLHNLAVRQGHQHLRSSALEIRIQKLEEAADDVIEIAPLPLSDQLAAAKGRVVRKGRKRSKAEKAIDTFAHEIFDGEARLRLPGGHYVIDNLGEDMLAKFPELSPDDIDFDFEEAIASALRWCDKRSKWYTKRRYWVEPVSNWLIIKYDRYWFRSEQVKQDKKARAKMRRSDNLGKE